MASQSGSQEFIENEPSHEEFNYLPPEQLLAWRMQFERQVSMQAWENGGNRAYGVEGGEMLMREYTEHGEWVYVSARGVVSRVEDWAAEARGRIEMFEERQRVEREMRDVDLQTAHILEQYARRDPAMLEGWDERETALQLEVLRRQNENRDYAAETRRIIEMFQERQRVRNVMMEEERQRVERELRDVELRTAHILEQYAERDRRRLEGFRPVDEREMGLELLRRQNENQLVAARERLRERELKAAEEDYSKGNEDLGVQAQQEMPIHQRGTGMLDVHPSLEERRMELELRRRQNENELLELLAARKKLGEEVEASINNDYISLNQ